MTSSNPFMVEYFRSSVKLCVCVCVKYLQCVLVFVFSLLLLCESVVPLSCSVVFLSPPLARFIFTECLQIFRLRFFCVVHAKTTTYKALEEEHREILFLKTTKVNALTITTANTGVDGDSDIDRAVASANNFRSKKINNKKQQQ